MKLSNIRRHGDLTEKQRKLFKERPDKQSCINWTHELALRAWNEKISMPNSQGEAVSASAPLAVQVTKPTGYSAFVFTKTLLETRGSFRDFEAWTQAVAAASPGVQMVSRKVGGQHVQSLARYERMTTLRCLQEGAVFRLQADGLARAYQVEIGTILWQLPASLRCYAENGEEFSWLERLGPRGPWIVERLIGARDFPNAMDTAGKVGMLEECVRRATLSATGDIQPATFEHVKKNVRAWASDGADRDVAFAATSVFPGLCFHAWDEAHSGVKLLQQALRDDSEVQIVDQLLVTRKKPPSLAKFLSTSDVFKRTFGDAQCKEEIAFVQNFGWAPQRYQSRARPYARESRRWHSIFSSVAKEATSSDPKRKQIATGLLSELGGENSPRLLLGGMLADLTVEHYDWVASGNKANPEATTTMSRHESFNHRLKVLFVEGLILRIPQSYTGATLAFLRQNNHFRFGKDVQSFGLGDTSQVELQRVVRATLQRVQRAVANSIALGAVYRPESSWYKAFEAFSLPSVLTNLCGVAAAADVKRVDECKASLVDTTITIATTTTATTTTIELN